MQNNNINNKKEYEKAVKEGKKAALLNQVRDDIFKINIGNIDKNMRVIAKLKYISKLTINSLDRIEFTFPVKIPQLYFIGSPENKLMENNDWLDFISTSFSADLLIKKRENERKNIILNRRADKVSIEIEIYSSEIIDEVISTSHSILVEKIDKKNANVYYFDQILSLDHGLF